MFLNSIVLGRISTVCKVLTLDFEYAVVRVVGVRSAITHVVANRMYVMDTIALSRIALMIVMRLIGPCQLLSVNQNNSLLDCSQHMCRDPVDEVLTMCLGHY